MISTVIFKKQIHLFIIILVSSTLLYAGAESENFKKLESTIMSYFNEIKLSISDDEKKKINQKIIETFEKIFEEKKSFDYSFKSLSSVGKLVSSDREIKIFTWNLPFSDGTHEYFGFVQFYSRSEKQYRWYRLIDKSDKIYNPETTRLSDLNWYGALYYYIITKQVNGKMYYVLLGVDFNDLFSGKKLIDVVHFSDNGDVMFGYPFFIQRNKILNRVIFEFSPMVSMALQYDKSRDMIIFDHLSPPDSVYKGQFHYYGPDSSYDGFHFIDGNWELVDDIDVRNRR
jgi:hypothetical protein